MNIIWLSPEAIYPPNTGGRIVVYNKIKYLSEMGHKIYLFCIIDSDDEIYYQQNEMKGLCFFAKYYNRKKRRIVKYTNSIFYPFSVVSRTSSVIEKDLQNTLNHEKIDIIWCEMPQMANNLKGLRFGEETKVVLSQQNVEFLSMRSYAKKINNPFKRIIYEIEAFKLKVFEESLIKSGLFNAYVFVSDKDLNFFKKEHNLENVPLNLCPIGAEDHGDLKRNDSNNIIIVGKMSYIPNVDGIIWFCDNVWPKVCHKNANVRLFIVGKDPDDRIMRRISDKITVTGTVESVEPYYLNAAVACIPIFSGGGVKTKLIEAISYKIPVVCTKLGAEGTLFVGDESIVIADDPETFCKGIIDALSKNDSVIERTKRAYEIFKNNYTWNEIIKDLDGFLAQLFHD